MLYPASTFLRRDPFGPARRFNEFDRAFFGPTATRGYPAVNVWHGPEAAAVTAELPGVEADDIDISVKNDVLTLSGERKRPATPDEATWHQRERAFGRFSRSIRIPFRVDPDNIEARLENGVLQVAVHRREEDKPRRIEVKAI